MSICFQLIPHSQQSEAVQRSRITDESSPMTQFLKDASPYHIRKDLLLSIYQPLLLPIPTQFFLAYLPWPLRLQFAVMLHGSS